MLRWIRDGGQVSEFEGVALVHLDLLYRAALRLTHNRAEAEDLVQETWLRAIRHFDQFDPGSNCRAWLLTILRNAFLNRLRREGREILESDMAATEAARPGSRRPPSPTRAPRRTSSKRCSTATWTGP